MIFLIIIKGIMIIIVMTNVLVIEINNDIFK